MKANKLGWATSLNINHSYDGLLTFDLSGVSTGDPNILMREMRRWVEDGISSATLEDEWMCLYCASPNSIKKTHCARCGAPRNFILG